MNPRYKRWILQWVGDVRWEKTLFGHWHIVGCKTEVDGEPIIQRCDAAAPMMAKAFPELKVVRGDYRGPTTQGYWMYHVWCVDKRGNIVDPTGRQFDERGKPDSYMRGQYRT